MLGSVVSIDLVDETFIAAPPDLLAPIVADPLRWARWWPDLQLTVFMDRGVAGLRWSVTGALVGSSEIWLEPLGDGTMLHYYLRADETVARSSTQAVAREPGPAAWRHWSRVRAAHAKAWKACVWALKDEVEGDRRPGTAAVQLPVVP